jgi:hypothetical protein
MGRADTLHFRFVEGGLVVRREAQEAREQHGFPTEILRGIEVQALQEQARHWRRWVLQLRLRYIEHCIQVQNV